jgi:ComF family protein
VGTGYPLSPLRRALRKGLDAVVSVLFPAPCRLCEAPLETASRIPVCPECLGSLRPFSGPACQGCGRPFASEQAGLVSKPLCRACRAGIYAFDFARSYGPYDEKMAPAILLLKHNAIAPLGAWFADRLAELIAGEPRLAEVDRVVPVPLHRARLRERGHNQAELIARPLAKRVRLPLAPNLLARIKPRPEKLRMSRRERWLSVRGAYTICKGKRVDKARILLIDDVFTTGATLDSCARVLRGAGAASVIALTVARATPNWVSWQGTRAGT